VIIAEDPEQEGKTILKRITHLAGEKGKNFLINRINPQKSIKTHKTPKNIKLIKTYMNIFI